MDEDQPIKPANILNIVATYAWTGMPGVVHSAKGRVRVLVVGIPDMADDDLFFPEDG